MRSTLLHEAHVDTFVIISGDSDFSPLVSKLRENDKTVIGVGVKNSMQRSAHRQLRRVHLLRRPRARRRATPATGAAGRGCRTVALNEKPARKQPGPSVDQALSSLASTLEALRAERDEDYEIHGSMVKQTMKRQYPGFNERAHGFRAFNDLLLAAQKRGLLKLESDKQAGSYIVRTVE